MTLQLPQHTAKWHKCNGWNWWPNDLVSWRPRASVIDFWSNYWKLIMYATDIQAQWAKSTRPSQQVSLKCKQESDCSEEPSLFSLMKSKLSSISSHKIVRTECIACFQYYMGVQRCLTALAISELEYLKLILFHPLYSLVNMTDSISVHTMLFSSHWTPLCRVKDLIKYIINQSAGQIQTASKRLLCVLHNCLFRRQVNHWFLRTCNT